MEITVYPLLYSTAKSVTFRYEHNWKMSKDLSYKDLLPMKRTELKELIVKMSLDLKQRLDAGEDIDIILDNENPFAIFERFMEPVEFPILVITMVNNFQSDTIMDTILDALEKGIESYNSGK
jgi:hypothetical protein|tara:strand:+ start:2090 stop:2455 length:366 start_codon:yes stop_codon:yes gene_type:complete